MSANVLAVAARRSLRILGWQAAWVAGLAVICAVLWGAAAGWSALAGGGIGSIGTVYMAVTLFKHSVDHGVRLSALSFLAAWAVKLVLTISLLIVAFRSGLPPLPLLAGLATALIAYWAWLTFRVEHADGADGK